MNSEFDKLKISSLTANVVLFALLIMLTWQYCNKPCQPCYDSGKTVVKIDTIYRDTSLKMVATKPLKPIRRMPRGTSRAHVDSVMVYMNDTIIVSEYNDCYYTNYYIDTIRSSSEEVKAVIIDTLVDNQIVGRGVFIANLRPVYRAKETIVKRETWKVYLGGSFTVNSRHQERWGAGVTAILTVPRIGAIQYHYDVRNNAHTGGLYALIRFRK